MGQSLTNERILELLREAYEAGKTGVNFDYWLNTVATVDYEHDVVCNAHPSTPIGTGICSCEGRRTDYDIRNERAIESFSPLASRWRDSDNELDNK